MEGFLLSPAAGVLTRILLLWGPLLTLAAMCVLTLKKLEPRRRRGLLPMLAVMLALAGVLFGGAAVLEQCGLAWRTWVQESLAVLLGLSGLSTGILTVVYAGRWLGGVKGPVTALCGFCLAVAMFSCSVMGLLWAAGPGEQVVTYRGQKAVLGKWVWMETSYELYAYHGPLVRGAGPLEADWDPDLVEGAIIDGG